MVQNELFRRSILFRGLTDEQIAIIATITELKSFGPSSELTFLGQQLPDVYVILSGQVNVLTHDGDKLADVGPGGIIGEIELVDAQPCVANSITVGHTEVAALPVLAFRKLLAANPAIGFLVLANLGQLLASRLRQADARLDGLLDQMHDGLWTNCL